MKFSNLEIKYLFRAAAIPAIAAFWWTLQPAHAVTYGESFSSPEEAARMLVKAAESPGVADVLNILGPSAKSILITSDKVSDARARRAFLDKAHERMLVTGDPRHPGIKTMEIGKDRWPFPIPIVQAGSRWHFDVERGKREVLMRRIGGNELAAIDICRGYVEAQNTYFHRDEADGVQQQYAQKFISSPGQRDGLYWRSLENGDESPIGELIARAISEGYTNKQEPFHGYYFKILKEQGSHAAGGEMTYMDGDAMTRGFAMIAWPSDYRSTGVMTFLVDRTGIVYQKDLGKNTPEIAREMDAYDPDQTWTPVAGSGVPRRRTPPRNITRAAR